MEIPRVLKNILNRPLEVLQAKDFKCIDKTIAGIMVGIFTVLSLGAYGVYSYRFFDKKRVKNLQLKLTTLVVNNNFSEAKALFKKFPGLKKANLDQLVDLAARNQNFDMIKLLIDKGGRVDGQTITETTLYKCLTSRPVRYDIIKYLLNRGADPNPQMEPSALSLMASSWNDNPEETKEILELMLRKGARFNEGSEDRNGICREAIQFIREIAL